MDWPPDEFEVSISDRIAGSAIVGGQFFDGGEHRPGTETLGCSGCALQSARRRPLTSSRIVLLRLALATLAAIFLVTQCCKGQTYFELGHPLYQFFSTRDYGGDNQNWKAIQDRNGLMFFGNNNYVLDYDGQRWEHIPVPGGLAIYGLALDAAGTIWVGGTDKLGNLVQAGGDWRFVPVQGTNRPPDTLGQVFGIVSCGNAEFVRGEHALLVFQNGSWDAISWPHGSGFNYLVAACANRVFVSTFNEPLYEIVNKRLVPLVDDPRLRTTVVYQALEPKPGVILLLTRDHGLFRLKQGGIEPFHTDIDSILAEYPVQSGTCTPGGFIAIGIEQHGVALLNSDGTLCDVLFQQNGLPDPNIFNLAPDRAGGLWTCGNVGLTRVDVSPGISFFDDKTGLPLSTILDLRRFRGHMYAATLNGLYELQKAPADALPSNFRKVPGATAPIPVTADVGSELLACGWKGFFSFDGVELKPVSIPIGLPNCLTSSKFFPARIYVGLDEGLAAISKADDVWRIDGKLGGFGGPVSHVIENGPDELFVSTLNRGFFRVKLQEGSKDELGSARLVSLATARNAPEISDSDAVATLDGQPVFISKDGIARYDLSANRFIPISTFESIFRDYMPTTAIVSAERDQPLFIAVTPRNPPPGSAPQTRIAQISSDGRFNFLPAAITRTIGDPDIIRLDSSSGSPVLWVGGTYGVARIDTREAINSGLKFNLFPREADTVSGISLPLPATGKALTLPFSLNDFQIRFANDRFAGRDEIRYRVKLEGLERNWSAPVTDPVWHSGSLREGAYTLHVVAEDEDGQKSSEATVAIRILPPWYRSWWMYMVYTCLGILCFLAFVRLRIWRLRMREKQLVQLVTVRTKQLEESQARLVDAKEAAEAANRAKSAFLANMSHELRTPLNSILGYTQLMLRNRDEPDEKRRRLTTIQSSGEHLLNMINDILDLAKVESGTIAVNLKPVQLKALLSTIADEMQLRASQKRLRFAYSADDSILEWISTDPVRLRQVLYNLLGNSIKFTDKGEVSLVVNRVDDRIRLEVRDTGKGIPEADLLHVFKAFYQASNNDQTGGGVGLGLHISQRIVRLLGGELQVSSKEGKGTVFRFELPAGELAIWQAPPTPQKVVRLTGERNRVLVVDDDATSRGFMLDLLREVGLEAKSASSVEEGFKLLRSEQFAAVLSDVRMGETSGITFCQEVRKDPKLAALVMIASSASVYVDDREAALAAGFNGFVPKPVNETTLFQLFENLLELKAVYGAVNEAETALESTEEAVNRPLMEPLPAVDQIDQLLPHAKLGDVIALRTSIRKLKDENPALSEFCRRISILTDKYLLSSVEKILEKAREQMNSARTHGDTEDV
jgi:signal transduction histidine kinase/CheY-like chemotaxis protein